VTHAALAGAPPEVDERAEVEAAVAGFTLAIEDGDLISASGRLSRDACVITPDGTIISSRDSIRTLIAQMIGGRVRVGSKLTSLVLAGDLALARGAWRTQVADASGGPYAQISISTVVLHKVEGEWKLQILAPWEGLAREERGS
jgi:ketosteroid isomerase-like protein